MMAENQTIVVEDLSKQFGDFTAVHAVSFQVEPGEIFGFLGPNGSGKTTTIRMMLGLLAPTAGSVQVLDMRVTEDPGALRARVGYMSQRFSLYNDLTVEQNLRFFGTAYGLNNAALNERMEVAVAMAGLRGREKVKAETLSGGWRQRLALSAAILHEPRVLFLDEPTAGVDPVSRREFWELLYQLAERGVTVFVTTHYMDEAEHCHRLAFIQRGELIASGTPRQLKQSLMQGHVMQISASDPTATIKQLRKAKEIGEFLMGDITLYGAFVHAIVGQDGPSPSAIETYLKRAGLAVTSIQAIEPSLEDVFIACMN